ncbi:MAG: tetratricopeptide repeat protein [Bacteroidota bacterium]
MEKISAINNEKNQTIPEKLQMLENLAKDDSPSMEDVCIGKILYLKSNYFRILGKYDSAQLFISQAKSIFNDLNDSVAISETINLEGTIKMAKGDYEDALFLFMTALEFGKSNHDPLWTAVTKINIGNIYFRRENYQKALSYFLKTLDIYQNTEKIFMKIKVLNNVGSCYEKLGEWEQAEGYFNQALSYAKETKDGFSIAFISQNIGHLLVQKKDFEVAKVYFEEALPLSEANNDTYGVAYCLLGIGMGHHGLNEFESARVKLDSAIQMASGIAANDLLESAYKHLYKIDSSSNRYADALIHYQKYKALQDSAIWTIKNKHVEEMLVKYETEQKLKDNEILLAKNSLQDERLTKQSFIIALIIIILLIMAISFHHTRKVNRLLIKNAQTVELQKCKLEQQAKELQMGNKVTQEINANLEKIVESRTLKINQQNTALRNYEFENSHSIRGPLARILGLVSLFNIDNLTDEQKVLIGSIDNSAKELDDIIKNMSKILGKA